ncbi:carbamoyltransferase HypF [Lentzea aerocolonigenes]|uniref:carbamoyltransferase HypF n=1 Tax=Lentzea aerocolonigenes TaxID=68170 RepID=UPI0004C2F0B5|nr:carbamoyltransferase HypF [Lentzea aerocolonigenes]MCP2250455.1 hydrogenase maturation protein HypF [Lentzea aerocolonigenes]
MSARVGRSLRVAGVVQGVGFRPFVHRLASRLRLSGQVGNDVEGVFIEIEGTPENVAEFLAVLCRDAPPRARIDRVQVSERPARGTTGFRISTSRAGPQPSALVPADVGTCADCLRELFDPADRRYRYPFVNCAHCGPRYTIVRAVPYDRARTTMARFPMCADCRTEYTDATNRRFHAEPICCPGCGPRLVLGDSPDPLGEAVARLAEGQVLAVKGLGGFHLAVLAAHPAAAAVLRARKRRPDKPFAVMVADLRQAAELCEVDDAEALRDPRGPIVLLPRRAGAPVSEAVAPGTNELGLLLPYTPLHHLLLRELGEPIVLTSGNVSDEPIAHRHARSLGEVADAVLTHDRPIRSPADDSVVRGGRVLRRARGFAPEPVSLPVRTPLPILACGAELKNTFCLVRDERAFLSPHLGDLSDHATFTRFARTVEHFGRLFGITPRVVAHDLHPDYRSTRYATDLVGVDLVGVQHHHAHAASCLAENDEEGPVIAVVFDGTGYGPDGTIWGGEFLVADLAGYRRIGHLKPVPMPGGATAIRQPWRMAAAYLPEVRLPVARRNESRWEPVVAMARNGVNAPLTSSAGRLFDAAAALLDVRDVITYEGQAAVELEQRADPSTSDGYRAGTEGLVVCGEDLLRALVADLCAGVDPGVVAARFHNGVADAIVACCTAAREETGLTSVALSGGVFQNALLLRRTVDGLRRSGFRVLTHRRVPPNDGGISLGQAAVAAALVSCAS